MNYNDAIKYLFDLSSFGWKLGLDKIKSMLDELDRPQEKYHTIHIAGTNGKGSTSAMIESILRSAGYRTGLYTSPHLVYVGERIKCNGQAMSQEELVHYIERIQPLIEKYKCTFFEAITAMAFLYFADQKIEIGVIEVGLGGRLDATNVITPLISIITNIDIDHAKQLGETRRSIAFEKAGIIKPGSICLTNSRYKNIRRLFEKICRERQAEHFQLDQLLKIENVKLGEEATLLDMTVNGEFYPELKLSLIGDHQIQNAALAVAAATILNSRFMSIKNEAIYQGLRDVQWPGRLQLISKQPRIILDVAHNPGGIASLIKTLRTIFHYERLIVVFGVCRDKDYRAMVKKIAPISDVFVAVKANTPRGLSAKTLAKIASQYASSVFKSNSIQNGLNMAMENARAGDLILCTGSHYVVGDILLLCHQTPN